MPHAPFRLRPRSAAAIVGAAALCALAPVAAAPAGAAGPSGSALEAQAASAALAARTVHVVAYSIQGGKKVVEVVNVGAGGGDETATQDGLTLHIVVVGNTIYVRGDAATLKSVVGASTAVADRYANRWLEAPSSANGIGQLAQVFSMRAFVSNLFQLGHPTVSVRGAHTVTLVGTLPDTKMNQGSGAGSRATLVLAGNAPHDPQSLTFSSSSAGVNSFTFSGWGSAVHEHAPSGAVPFADLTGNG